MDFSLVSTAVSALTSAKELGKAAMAVRDFNQVADIVAKLNEQLLHAQEALFRHNGELFRLQQEHAEAVAKLGKMESALAERGRYTLAVIGNGQFAYQSKVMPDIGEESSPGHAEPQHYVCQACFDRGVKTVLQKSLTSWGAEYWLCGSCKAELLIRD
jgi:hypothetical protein